MRAKPSRLIGWNRRTRRRETWGIERSHDRHRARAVAALWARRRFTFGGRRPRVDVPPRFASTALAPHVDSGSAWALPERSRKGSRRWPQGETATRRRTTFVRRRDVRRRVV